MAGLFHMVNDLPCQNIAVWIKYVSDMISMMSSYFAAHFSIFVFDFSSDIVLIWRFFCVSRYNVFLTERAITYLFQLNNLLLP